MPLLKKEPWTFPNNLFTEEMEASLPGQWWVLHTRPRTEKALARRLVGRGIPFFLPMYEKTWKSGGRRLTSFLPLFPSYVFLHADELDRGHVLETNLVARCIEVKLQSQLRQELNQIHRLISSDTPLLPEERLRPGTPVRVIDGQFTGITGKILPNGKQNRLLVEIELLQRGVSIPVDPWMVEVLSD